MKVNQKEVNKTYLKFLVLLLNTPLTGFLTFSPPENKNIHKRISVDKERDC